MQQIMKLSSFMLPKKKEKKTKVKRFVCEIQTMYIIAHINAQVNRFAWKRNCVAQQQQQQKLIELYLIFFILPFYHVVSQSLSHSRSLSGCFVWYVQPFDASVTRLHEQNSVMNVQNVPLKHWYLSSQSVSIRALMSCELNESGVVFLWQLAPCIHASSLIIGKDERT